MFINTKILKSLMKTTYKGYGLILAQTEDRFYIAGSCWEMDVIKKYMPKTIMAQMIDLAGEVPGIGERKKYYSIKGKEESCDCKGNLEVFPKECVEAEITNLLLASVSGDAYRIIQTGDHLEIVKNIFAGITDRDSVDKNVESNIQGPFFEGTSFLWKTNIAQFRAYKTISEKYERLLEELSMIDLTEDPV